MCDVSEQIVIAIVTGLLGGSGVATAVTAWILNRLDRPNAESRALQTLLFLKLKAIQKDMAANRGVCPLDVKEDAEKIYRSYHELGGNGLGTQIIEDFRSAHIEPDTVKGGDV